MDASRLISNRLAFAASPIYRFGAGRSTAALEILERQKTATTLEYLRRPDELQLDTDNTTRCGGYRIARAAFSPIATLLASGMSNTLADLGGLARRADKRNRLFDGALARSLWNRVVELRFSLLRDVRILRNEADKTIDGVLGPEQRYVDNHSLLTAVLPEFAAKDLPLYGIAIHCRELMLWFRRDAVTRIATNPGEAIVAGGVYLLNSEFRGTMRATKAVLTNFGILLGPYRTFGVRVAGAKRLSTTAAALAAVGDGLDEFKEAAASRLVEAAHQPVGFTPADTEEVITAVADRIVRELVAHGIESATARRVTDRLLAYGGRVPDGIPDNRLGRVLADRTRLDTVAAMTRLAVTYELYRRERLELAAWRYLLTGSE